MTEFERASLRAGLQSDGWIVSQSLLIWGKDEKGRAQNVIIDGEHRWVEATALGLTQGPAVVLDGLTEAEAKKLTIKLDNKRGKFDKTKLHNVLAEIVGVDSTDGLAFELGFTDLDFTLLTSPLETLPPDEFREVTIDAKTDYCCPKCNYKWSGSAARKSKSPKAGKPADG